MDAGVGYIPGIFSRDGVAALEGDSSHGVAAGRCDRDTQTA